MAYNEIKVIGAKFVNLDKTKEWEELFTHRNINYALDYAREFLGKDWSNFLNEECVHEVVSIEDRESQVDHGRWMKYKEITTDKGESFVVESEFPFYYDIDYKIVKVPDEKSGLAVIKQSNLWLRKEILNLFKNSKLELAELSRMVDQTII